MRAISGETKLLGLLGHNTSYTLSPSIHNEAIRQLYLDQVYVNFDLPQSSVANFLNVFWEMGGVGLNVTKPYKNLVASYLTSCPHKSVNTLVRGNHGWNGFSTDGQGFARGLDRIGVAVADLHHVLILGSGGASQAIVQELTHNKSNALKSLRIVRRSERNDSFLMEACSPQVCLEFLDWSESELRQAVDQMDHRHSLMIQATSAPSQGHDLSEFLPAFTRYQGAFVDLIYDNPSALYFESLNRGLKTQDGLAMLIEQARLSQELWWGKSAPYETLARAIKNTGRLTKE